MREHEWAVPFTQVVRVKDDALPVVPAVSIRSVAFDRSYVCRRGGGKDMPKDGKVVRTTGGGGWQRHNRGLERSNGVGRIPTKASQVRPPSLSRRPP